MDREDIEEAIEVLEDASAQMLMETGDENYYAEAIAILRQALSGEAVKHIKTWNERCEEHPDHQERIISERMIQERMQEEIDELRQALEQEPFEYWNVAHGWVKIDEVREHFDSVGCGTIYKSAGEGRSPLYTTPPKKPWVGLTDDEIYDCEEQVGMPQYEISSADLYAFAQAIEAKLREKNT